MRMLAIVISASFKRTSQRRGVPYA